MPRIKGARRIFGRFCPPVGQDSSTISPDTWRTAIAVTAGPRIMMPSIRAWPPIEVFFTVFGSDITVFLSMAVRRRYRQRNDHRRPHALFAFDVEPSFMAADDLIRQGQSDPGAGTGLVRFIKFFLDIG